MLEHAAELFARKGFSQTSMREIAEAAGVTKPMLYYYFGNKADLIRTLLSTSLEGYLETVEGVAHLPLEAALRALADEHVRFCDEHPAILSLMLRLESTPPEIAGTFDVQEAQMRCFVATVALFADAPLRQPPDVAAQAFMALLFSALFARLRAREQPDMPAPPDVGAVLDLFLYGVLPTPPGDGK